MKDKSFFIVSPVLIVCFAVFSCAGVNGPARYAPETWRKTVDALERFLGNE